MLDGFVYRRQQPPEEEEKKTGKVVWERFVNSQNGGGKLKAEDTPGTEAFVKKREQFYAVGVVESVNVHTCTVSIVIVENDATMGSATAPLTDKRGEWAFNSEQHSSGLKATLYKNVPMEKACIHGYEGFVAPYDHPPPAVYKPVPGHYTADEFLAYDVTKDSPVELLKLLENGEEVEGLTRQKLALLPEGRRLQEEEAPTSERSSVLEGWEVLGDGSSVEGSELELWSLCESDSWDLVSRASQSNRSFEVVSMVYEQSGSLSHSFHVVPSGLSALSSSLGSYDLVHSQAPSQAGSVASRISVASERSLLTLRSALPAPESFPADRGHPGSWQLLSVLCKLNVPLRGTVRSLQDFGAFVSLDATPRDLAVQNNKLVSGGRPPKGKGKGKSKGKGKGKSDGETKLLQDGLLPCLPYMRPSWPPGSTGEQGSSRDSSVMVNGNVFEQMGRQTLGPAEADVPDRIWVVVYISEVDVNQRRMKLSLQPRLTFEELRIGGKHEGIVVDTSHLGLFVALSDSLVGLLPRAQLGVGAFAEGPEEDGWYRRSVYKRGDIVTVWVLRKALADANSRRPYKIDLTMDKYNEELSSHFLKSSLKVLDAGASGRQPGAEDPKVGKTAMDLKFEETFDAEDKFFLIKNNRLIKDAMAQYPELVIDYTTDPPPPPQEATKTKSFDFSLIEGWSVRKITEEHKRLCDKQHKFEESAQGAKPLSKEEERLLTVLKKKVEQWGNEYYEGVCKKIERHQKFIEDIHRKIKEERDKYPYKSIIDLDKFRELSQRIAEKGYHERCCFVTRLCYKEDVLGVGLEIVPESDTGRKIFQCSFDLLSKEAFKDFGIRSGVWKEKVEFWLPLAIDARHFRRALPYLAECFRQLGDGRVEAATRSYGTQAGNGIKSLRANLRELQRTGQKMLSLEEYKKQKAQPEKEKPKPEAEAEKTQPVGLRPAASLTEADVAYGLEVLPKLMNLQTVQLMKGDLHLSTKALEGYMGFHHLLLSILRQYPSLQAQVESKIGTFLRSEAGRTKQSCPNLGEFLCLLAVSKKYTWDDVSAAVLKETLDRNASWALDKYPSLAGFGTSPENRLERTFKASIVSIRLLCFNVWFLRNVVFKRYGAQATSAEILEEQRGGPKVSCTDMRWAEYEEQKLGIDQDSTRVLQRFLRLRRKGIPRPEEINMLQEQMRRTLHGNGLNSWSEYFVNLNLQPLKADDLSQLLVMSLHDSVRKGYIPLWKMRALQQKNQQEKAPKTNDYLGADMDKYDSMHTTKGGGDRW
ncbi:ubc14 [Symbiodinium sp. KB8]|nr:ubc14 [Symbiodinium sp. KB8]